MLKRRKQIINPLVGFGQRPIGPYANRIGQSTYARNVALKGGLERPSDFLAFSATSQGVIKALVRGQGSVTFGRATGATVTDFEGLVSDCVANELRFENARRVENLFTDITTTLANGSATTAVTVGVGTFVFSMGAGSGTATFSGTATGSSGTLDADASNRTAETLTITAAGTIIVTASVAALSDIQLENVTGQTNQNPSEYVSVGVATGSEEAVDTDFSNESAWDTVNASVTFSAPSGIDIDYSGAFDNLLVQDAGCIANKTYVYSFTVDSYTSGTAIIRIGNTALAGITAAGTYTGTVVAASTDSKTFSIQGSAVVMSFSAVSIKEADHGANIDSVKYFAYLNGNTVDGSNVVTEAKGNDIGVDFVGTNHDLSDWTLLEGLTLGGSVTALDGTTLTNNGLIPTAEGSKYHGIAKNDIDMGADNVPIRFYFLAYEGTTKNWVALSILNRENLRCTQFWDVTSGAPAVGSQAGTLTGVPSVVDLGSGWSMCILDVDSGSGSSQPTYEIYPADSDGDHQTSGDGSTPYVYIDYPRAMIGTEPWRALFEPANTNLVEDSWDLTAASWAETGTSVSALDAVGIGGRANTATTLTDDDGAAHEYVSDTYSITGDSPVSYIVWIRRDTDQTRFPTLRSVLSGGTGKSADIWLNTETGATQGAGDTANLEIDATAVGNFWVLTVTHTDTGTNTTGVLQIYPSRGTVFGTANVAATGSIEVAQVDWLDDTVHGFAVSTTPIPTSGGSDSRSADDASPMFDYSNWSQTEGTWYVDVWWSDVTQLSAVISIWNTNSANVLTLIATGTVRSQDGTVMTNAAVGITDNVRHRVLLDFSTSDDERFTAGKDIDGAGSWVWSNDGGYDGEFQTTDVFNIAYGLTIPIRLRDLKGFTTRKGKDWVEENE